MAKLQMIDNQSYELYACLPFVELDQEKTIQMGPVLFWPTSRSKEWMDHQNDPLFREYMHSIGQIKARSMEEQKFINTVKLNLQETTAVSLAYTIPKEQQEHALIDSLYLLYFACTFRGLYYGHEIPSFDCFRKIIPASVPFISQRQNWESVHIDETYREETVCIYLVDRQICQGLGEMLNVIYTQANGENQTKVNAYKRLIRAIRYLVDRFFQRFVNLLDHGLNLSEAIFEPEDVMFMTSSFESLFDIDDQQVIQDFKHKLRPFLHLKYSTPVELFWKWVDDLYAVKHKMVHGGTLQDPLFRSNPNFEVSHLLLGMRLLIYAIYYMLFKEGLLPSIHQDSYTPPDFKWIHPEEIVMFFWTENALLRQIYTFIKHIQEEPAQEELYAELLWLSTLFVSLYTRYYWDQEQEGIRFIPQPLPQIAEYGHPLLKELKGPHQTEAQQRINQVIHPDFLTYLEMRLKPVEGK